MDGLCFPGVPVAVVTRASLAVAGLLACLAGLAGTAIPTAWAQGPGPVSVTVAPQQVRPGQTVRLCAHVHQTGFVSLWNIGTSGRVSRLMPAPQGQGAPAQAVTAGGMLCTPPGLQISGPPGVEGIEALWAAAPQAHPSQGAFPSVQAFADVLARAPGGPIWRAQGQLVVLPSAQASADVTPPGGSPSGSPAGAPGMAPGGSGAAGTIAAAPPQPQVGQPFSLCFTPAAAGYASFWNVGSSGRVARLWPGAQDPTPAAAVAAGAPVCLGGSGSAVTLTAPPQPGQEGLRLLLSAGPQAHPTPGQVPDRPRLEAFVAQGVATGQLAVTDHTLVIAGPGSSPATTTAPAAGGAVMTAGVPGAPGAPGAPTPAASTADSGLFARGLAPNQLTPGLHTALAAAQRDPGVTAARLALGPTGAEAVRLLKGGATREVGSALAVTLMPGVTVGLEGTATATRADDGLSGMGGAGMGGAGSTPHLDGGLSGGGGSGLLMATADGMTGRFSKDGMIYTVSPLGDGTHLVTQIDPERLPPEHAPGAYEQISAEATARGPAPTPPPGATRDMDGATIDLLVVVTPAVIDKKRPIMSAVRQWVRESNIANETSGVPAFFRLVGLEVADLEETTMLDDVKALIDPTDGRADEVPALRDRVKADLVVAVAEYDRECGLAAGLLPSPDKAYAMVSYHCALAMYTFTHEIGHLLGARHDVANDDSDFPFPYGHGYVAPDQSFRTLMSYPCGEDCDRIKAWSTPQNVINGEAIGDPETAYNAKAIEYGIWRVMAFR